MVLFGIEDVLDRLYFRKSQRITSDKDFARVLANRCVIRRGVIRIYAAANGLDVPRFAVTISKSCGNAVERNRLKRLAREVFRKNQYCIEKGFDYIVAFSQTKAKTASKNRPKPGLKITFKELERTLMDMLFAAANLAKQKKVQF